MDGIEIIIVVMVLIGFVILNYRTPVVEGAGFIRTPTTTATTSTATTSTATKSTATTSTAAAPTQIPVPPAINTAATTELPIDFKEFQVYLEKIKKYSADAEKMSSSVSNTAEDFKKAFTDVSGQLTKLSNTVSVTVGKAEVTAKKLSDTVSANVGKAEDAATKAAKSLADINSKASEIQANINTNSIANKDIEKKNIEIKDIGNKVSQYAIDASMSAIISKNASEEAKKAAAEAKAAVQPSVQPSVQPVDLDDEVEGFAGFNSSVLEGYTVFSNPNLPGGSQGKSAMDLENSLVEKINVFNQVYYGYLSETVKPGTTTKYAISDVDNARGELNTAISALNAQIGVIGSTTPKTTDVSFNNNHTSIKTTAAQIETLRSDLDMKMQEILKAKEGIPADHNIKHDTAAYTTILWTALATSVLYFVFVKIE